MKILLSLSGGLDSGTLLAQAILAGNEVLPVSFSYGSKHNKYENEAVHKLLKYYKIASPLKHFDLIPIMKDFKSDLMLSGGEVPEGHYEESNMTRTVVPGRNTIFVAILSGYALTVNASEIWLGIHAGDHLIYPDCRPDFFYSMREAIQHATERKVSLLAPFLHMNKAQILKRGLSMSFPYHFTRTCYKDQQVACGKCGSCQERLEAFMLNKAKDPLEYESRELMKKQVGGILS